MATTLPAPWLADKVGELSVMFCKQEGASRCRMKSEDSGRSSEVESWEGVGVGHGEDMTAGEPASCTQATGGAIPPLFVECTLCPPFPRWELFQELALESKLVLSPSGWYP